VTGLARELPWDSISPVALEELIFALMVEMGAAEVEWRSPMGAINTPDGGRDVEAVFNIPTPDGDVERQEWWIDAKRRSGIVASTDVKHVAVNSAAYNISTMIIATNTSFSNPAREWVREYNAKHVGSPTVKLWDRHRLQTMVDRYPAAAVRSFLSALNFEDRIEFLASYFFEQGRTLSVSELELAWEERASIEDEGFLVAACYSDITTGGLQHRPWGGEMSEDALRGAFVLVLTALPRAIIQNVTTIDENTATATAAYLASCAIARLSPHLVQSILGNPFSYIAELEECTPEPWRAYLVRPIQWRILYQTFKYCTADCARYSIDLDEEAKKAVNHWRTFLPFEPVPPKRAVDLAMINRATPCAVGLSVESVDCPLEDLALTSDLDDERFVQVLREVIRFRMSHPDGQDDLYRVPIGDCSRSAIALVEPYFNSIRKRDVLGRPTTPPADVDRD
jgi:hypothetical protein